MPGRWRICASLRRAARPAKQAPRACSVHRLTRHDLRRTRDLLGKRAESPDVAALLQSARLPYALSPDAERGTVAVTSPEGATHTAEELVVRCAGSGQTCPALLLHCVASQVCGKPGAPHHMGIAPRGRLRLTTTKTVPSRHIGPAAALAAGTTA